MKKVYRFLDNKTYWDNRWVEADHDNDQFHDLSIYPIRYAEMVMLDKNKKALEIGCGLGRVLKHYYTQGFQIRGIERSEVAVKKLKIEKPELEVQVGDVVQMSFPDNFFDVVLAYGVYHNLENTLLEALQETARILKVGGMFSISMRPDNLEMRINEYYWRWKQRSKAKKGEIHFHKLLVKEQEFKKILLKMGLKTTKIYRARNVSMLYRVPLFRKRENQVIDETIRRSEGYQLNKIGEMLDRFLRRLFPYQMSNVLIFIGSKE